MVRCDIQGPSRHNKHSCTVFPLSTEGMVITNLEHFGDKIKQKRPAPAHFASCSISRVKVKTGCLFEFHRCAVCAEVGLSVQLSRFTVFTFSLCCVRTMPHI